MPSVIVALPNIGGALWKYLFHQNENPVANKREKKNLIKLNLFNVAKFG